MLNWVLAASFITSVVAVQDPEAIWATITPSSKLVWTPCYNNKECARFQVPLDYKQPNGTQGAIALLKIPSALNASDAAYRGPVLFNPGGPGGSGIDWILSTGSLFQQILGPEYDIVGFDPRGVARTVPTMHVFKSQAEITTFTVQTNDDPALGTSPDAIGRALAHYKQAGLLTKARAGDIAPYLTTALVCRDMLGIVRAHGKEKLLFFGQSYGAIIGTTFASMFPQNVGRIAVDGVLDANDYYATEWLSVFQETDQTELAYYKACFKAGPQGCAIYDKSPEAIKARVYRALEPLKTEPIAVLTSADPGPLDHGIIDYMTAKNWLNSYITFAPYGNGPEVAKILAALEKGDGVPLWKALQAGLTGLIGVQCASGDAPAQPTTGVELWNPIVCTDGAPVNDTPRQLQEWYETNALQSSFASTLNTRVVCAGWKIRPAERFSGRIGGKTSFPLLFLNNILDPLTPYVSAQDMQRLFPGSGLLSQNAIGHTTFTATSQCTYQAIRVYIRDGTLPKPGTLCEVEETLFPVNTTDKSRREGADPLADVYRQITKQTQAWSATRKNRFL